MASGDAVLTVGPHRTWHRFWGAEESDLEPSDATLAAVQSLRAGTDCLADDWQNELDTHLAEVRRQMLRHHGLRDEQIALEVICGAKLPLGSRSRAAAYDVVTSRVPGLVAHEHGDGALAYGPGKSFWTHPRCLPLRIKGLNSAELRGRLQLVMHSFDPLTLSARYNVRYGETPQRGWALPADPWHPDAWYCLAIDAAATDASGTLTIRLEADQQPVL